MMHHVRHQLSIERPNIADRGDEVARIEAATPPAHRMKREPFSHDGVPVIVDTGCDMDIEAGRVCGARHRQQMRKEITIYGDEIDETRRG
jgi:hypothetical protein